MRKVIIVFSVLVVFAIALSAYFYFTQPEECRDPLCLDSRRLMLDEFHTVYSKESMTGSESERTFEGSVEVWDKGEKARYHFKPSQGDELVGLDRAGNISFCLGKNDSFYCENVPYEDDFFVVSDFTTPFLLPLFPKAKDPAAIKGLPPDEFEFFTLARLRLFKNIVYTGTQTQLGAESLCFSLKEGHDLPNVTRVDICYNSDGMVTSYAAERIRDGQLRREYIELKKFDTAVDDAVFTLPSTSTETENTTG